MRRERQKGFTLIELLVVVVVLVIIVCGLGFGIIGAGMMGNHWFTEEGVLRDLQVDHPEVVKILRSKTHIYGYSEILAGNRDGSHSTYTLDTNILYNYELRFVSTNAPPRGQGLFNN